MKEVTAALAWAMVAATVLLTTYGQLVLKWQVGRHDRPLFAFLESWPPILQMLTRPWVISALGAAFLASLAWMMALSRLDLSRAYPFMALNFLLVGLLAVPLFGETLTWRGIVGLLMVIAGLVVMNTGR